MTHPAADTPPGGGAAVLARLPPAALGVPHLDADPAWRLAAAFLLGYRGHTRRAYFTDIRAWYTWCAGIDLAPLQARRHHVDRWIAEQVERPQPGTGRPVAAATVARRLSCRAGLYEYAVVDVGLIDTSPVLRVKRPRVSDRSSTTGLVEADSLGGSLAGAPEGVATAVGRGVRSGSSHVANRLRYP